MKFIKSIKNTKGQALVETALVTPLMVFVILGILQITMIQHARIMTEYAAYYAARAGIVWDGDPYVMENAAIIALMPTYDRVTGGGSVVGGALNPSRLLSYIIERALLYQVNRRLNGWLGNMIAAGLSDAIRDAIGSIDRQVVQVEILHPRRNVFGSNNHEIDFDDIGTDSRARRLRQANKLTIRVSYLYLMRIPFANWVIHHAWLASRAGFALYGAIWNPQKNTPGATGFASEENASFSIL